MPSRRPSYVVLRSLEAILLVFGIAALGYYAYRTVEARQIQHARIAAFDAERAAREMSVANETESSARGAEGGRTAASSGADGSEGSLLGVLEIPRLHIAAPVMSGDDEETLAVAVGHLPDTPRPWEPGNSALAAHRDGLFRPLRRVRAGDEIVLRTRRGDFTYRVRETRVVEPTDLSVLAPTPSRTLTLITCYPFDYVGPAPMRFVVHADLVVGSVASAGR
jgi:sortase A